MSRETSGLKRLNAIIDFVLKYGMAPRKEEKKLFNSLMSFKMAKHNFSPKKLHFESYDRLCVDRGVPDLLNIKGRGEQTNSKTPINGYVSKVEKSGLKRLNIVIDFVLKNKTIPTNSKIYYSLRTFRNSKNKAFNGAVYFESYEKLCIERGVPDLLNINHTRKETLLPKRKGEKCVRIRLKSEERKSETDTTSIQESTHGGLAKKSIIVML